MAADYAQVASGSGNTAVPSGVLEARNKAANAYDNTILDKATVVGAADVTRSNPAAGTLNIYNTKVGDEGTAKTNYDRLKLDSDAKLATKTAATSAWNLATT